MSNSIIINGLLFKQIIENMNSYTKDTLVLLFEINGTLKIECANDCKTLFVINRITDIYEKNILDKDYKINITLSNLIKILKTYKYGDITKLSFTNEDLLKIHFENKSIGRKLVHNVKLLELDENELNFSKLEDESYDNCISIKTDKLLDIVSSLNMYKDKIKFKFDKKNNSILLDAYDASGNCEYEINNESEVKILINDTFECSYQMEKFESICKTCKVITDIDDIMISIRGGKLKTMMVDFYMGKDSYIKFVLGSSFDEDDESEDESEDKNDED